MFLNMPPRNASPERSFVKLNIRTLLFLFLQVPLAFDHATLGGLDEDLLSPQPRIRGNKPLNTALETLVRMSSIQKPRDTRISGILDGLASSWPTSFSQTLFEKFW